MTLESNEIPSRWWRMKGGDLSAGAQQILRAVLRGFRDHGTPPSRAELEQIATQAGMSLEAALAELAGHDMLVADAATGAILGAYPFSAAVTAHRVTIEGLASVAAMCAVDALGIPFLVQRPVTIRSSDMETDAPLLIHLDPVSVRAVAEPSTIAVFAGSTSSEGAAATCRCPFINFFRSAEAAATFGHAHPELRGTIVSLAEAIDWGRRVFEDLDGLLTA